MKRFGLVVAVLLFGVLAYAGPNTVMYQGCVVGSGGGPVADNTYPMRFRLYGVATGGTHLWEELETGVQVANGLFSTTLGDGATAFGTLFANNANLWLEVAIDLDRNGSYIASEVYAPRQKLAGAAWAIEADTLDGKHASDLGDITGVAAGAGLTGGGTTGNVTVSADTAYLQRRVTGTAPAGQFLTGINGDGTVAASPGAAGDITGVAAGTGLTGGGTAGDVAIAADTTYLQRRVTGAAPAGQFIRSILADGSVLAANAVGRVVAGTGLMGGGTGSSVTLSANTVYLQRRVLGTAPAGRFITGINGDGSVATRADQVGAGDITGVAAGEGLSGGGTSGSVTLAVRFEGNGTSQSAARANHAHAWNEATSIPAGFADGTDDVGAGGITGVVAGTGLDGGGTTGTVTLDVEFAGNGIAETASRSDHNHDAQYVNEGQAGAITSTMIADGATLSEILDNDGAGSGLDADLLDGQHAAAFADVGHNHDTSYSGISHNHDATYVNENQANSITSAMIVNGTITGTDVAVDTLTAANLAAGSVTTSEIADGSIMAVDIQDGAALLEISNNDGAGSGLDADLLDGQQGAFYQSANNINAGTLSTSFYSAFADLTAEGYLGNLAGDLAQNNGFLQATLNADLLDGRDAGNAGGNVAVNNGALNTNLNADLLDGAHAGNAGGNVPINNGTLNTILNADLLDGAHAGNANGNVPINNGTLNTNLNADQLDGNHAANFWNTTGNAGLGGANFIGTTDNVPLEIRINNSRVLRLEPGGGIPNIRGGYAGNGVTTGAFGVVIAGGGFAGNANSVTDALGTVGGGYANQAGNNSGPTTDAEYATVAGGGNNRASANGAAVGGGSYNTASESQAVVSGGFSNVASGPQATVAGGNDSTASGEAAVVGGGYRNAAGSFYATVAGGSQNSAVGFGYSPTVGGGRYNTASAGDATVAGGLSNVASGPQSTVGGGDSNVASATDATVAGGYASTASAQSATVGGGQYNVAGGWLSTVPGGYMNEAQGMYSFAAGRQAHALHPGCFVWADSNGYDFATTAPNQFQVRATGGVQFVSAINIFTGAPTAGVMLAPGGGGWESLSDRSAKENFVAVDGVEVLNRLAAIPVETWNMKSQNAAIRHIGPMAQDFSAAFGVGESSQYINTVDADGVALAAIQGLYKLFLEKVAELSAMKASHDSQGQRLDMLQTKVAELTAEKADQRQQISALQAQNVALETRLAALETMMTRLAAGK